MEFEVDAAVREAVTDAQAHSPAAPAVQTDVLYEMTMATLEGELDDYDPVWLHLRVVQAIQRHT